jgi:hypothetical protein
VSAAEGFTLDGAVFGDGYHRIQCRPPSSL